MCHMVVRVSVPPVLPAVYTQQHSCSLRFICRLYMCRKVLRREPDVSSMDQGHMYMRSNCAQQIQLHLHAQAGALLGYEPNFTSCRILLGYDKMVMSMDVTLDESPAQITEALDVFRVFENLSEASEESVAFLKEDREHEADTGRAAAQRQALRKQLQTATFHKILSSCWNPDTQAKEVVLTLAQQAAPGVV